jgi:hypothetical protein
MKLLFTILFFFFSLSIYCQIVDTIGIAIGEWKFNKMFIKGDTSYRVKYFHATDLVIHRDKFEIGLSEAYADGKFSDNNKNIVGYFSKGDEVFDIMTIDKISRNRITIRLETSTPEYWTIGKWKNIVVYLTYKRKK